MTQVDEASRTLEELFVGQNEAGRPFVKQNQLVLRRPVTS